ncbi:MAG TPA: T9SS type A sorting domain-containing protein, partial [Aequorivita sp.]|nr:T9SS type A sorting domain-containing protein [Aequorivita sp.]
AFYDQATDGYDRGLDGLSAKDLQTDAFFPIGNDNARKPYVINGIKFELNKQIPIAFKIKNQTKLDIKAVEEIKKPYTQAYIFDNVENTYQQITGGQSASYNLPTGNYNNRFFVVFRNPNIKRDVPQTELDANKIVMERVTFFQNNPQHQLEISNPEGYTLKSASVYDMSGKLVISETNLGDNTKYSFYTGNLSNGVYLVKLMTSDDIAIDYKAIVHN